MLQGLSSMSKATTSSGRTWTGMLLLGKDVQGTEHNASFGGMLRISKYHV